MLCKFTEGLGFNLGFCENLNEEVKEERGGDW